MNIFQIERSIAEVEPDIIFEIFGFPIANTLLMSIFITFLLLLSAIWINRNLKFIPGKTQLFMEVIYEAMENLVAEIVGERKRAEFIFPLIGAIFVYIGIANLIGFVPGVTSFTYEGEQLLRIATTDFNTTFGLSLALVILFNLMAVRHWGLLSYLGRFIKVRELAQGFRKGIGGGFIALMEFFVGLLDIISEIAKVISLSMRLFGNIYAGEVLAVIILGAFAYGLPSLWMALSILFAVVQAVVFGALSVAYYDMAISPGEEAASS